MKTKGLNLILIFLSLSIIFLFACKEKEEEKVEVFTLKYEDSVGGVVLGENRQEVVKGEAGEKVEALASYCYEFVSWSDGVESVERQDIANSNITVYPIFKKVIFEYPLLVINTKDSVAITSKEDYVKCTVTVNSNEFSEYEIENAKAKIRGRGNSTWGMPKKPYKLKFDDKIDFLGMGKAKTFTLIANYCDKSLLRNYLAFKVAMSMSEVHYTTEIRTVELVLNGEYVGLYNVCEQNEAKENRVEIDTTKGDSFFVELDQRAKESGLKEGFDYFTIDGKMYVLKHPDPEDDGFTSDDCLKVQSFFNWAYKLVTTGTYEEICQALDVESFAST